MNNIEIDFLILNFKIQKLGIGGDCHTNSKLIAEELKKLGYDVKVVRGVYINLPNKKIKHSWIEFKDKILETDCKQFHRIQALKEVYGNNFEIDVVIHKYNDDQLLRGMVIENLTQRAGDFKEEIDNLIAVRNYLKKINRSESEQMKSKRNDGVSDLMPNCFCAVLNKEKFSHRYKEVGV